MCAVVKENVKLKGFFVCRHCGEYNADANGAMNIAKKFERNMGYMPLFGAEVSQPLTVQTAWKPMT